VTSSSPQGSVRGFVGPARHRRPRKPGAVQLFGASSALGLLVGCAAAPGLDRAELPPLERYSDEPAVVLREQRIVELYAGSEGPEARSTYRRRLLITSSKGRDRGDFATGYDADFGRMETARAVVYRPDGEPETFGFSEWRDDPAIGGFSVYTNSRVVYLDLPDLPAGTVVDIETVETRRQTELFAERFAFGGYVPHLEASFEVRAPEGWELQHRTQRAGKLIDFEPTFDGVEDGARVIRWSRTDVATVPDEPYGPSFEDLVPVPAVHLTRWEHDGQVHHGMASMGDYARFLAELQAGTAEPDSEIERVVEEVLADVPDDPHQKAARLYGWVQENVRYVSIQVGMGGWRPYSATDVMRNRFGDCKDKATLLKSMLSVAGIESQLASLYAHDGIPREFVFPRLGFTNHAILAIDLPNERVVVDPTTRTTPFGQLPIGDQEAPLLLVGADEHPVIRTPASPPEQNRRETRLELNPDGPGDWSGRVELTAHGAIAARLHRSLLGEPSDAHRRVANFAGVESTLTGNVEWGLTADDGSSVSAEATVEFRQVGSKVGDRWLIRPNDLLRTRWVDLQSGPRRTPVLLGMRKVWSETVEVDLDGGRALAHPEPVELESRYGHYRLRWSATETGARLERRLTITQPRVPPEDYEHLMQFLNAMRTIEAKPIQLSLGDDAP